MNYLAAGIPLNVATNTYPENYSEDKLLKLQFFDVKDHRFVQRSKNDEYSNQFFKTGQSQNPKATLCITMYNEDYGEIERTIQSILMSVNELSANNQLNPSEFQVFLICDGYQEIQNQYFRNNKKSFLQRNSEKTNFFPEQKLIENGVLIPKKTNDNKNDLETQSYENTQYQISELPVEMQKGLDNPEEYVYDYSNMMHFFHHKEWKNTQTDKMQDINLYFGVKSTNKGKINSHKWFYEMILSYIKPQYVIHFDAGTEPYTQSLVKLFDYMDNNINCAGCSGEIQAQNPGSDATLIEKFWYYTQLYEYKGQHYPDKIYETQFQQMTLLPGAYSMYRLEPLVGKPLNKLFNSYELPDQSLPVKNQLLAEDRLPISEIINLKGKQYYTTFIPDAPAFTDIPVDMTTLVKQRRRWINGAMFIIFHRLLRPYTFCALGSNHSAYYKFKQMIFYILTLLSVCFSLSGVGVLFGVTDFFVIEFLNNYYSQETVDQCMWVYRLTGAIFVPIMTFIGVTRNFYSDKIYNILLIFCSVILFLEQMTFFISFFSYIIYEEEQIFYLIGGIIINTTIIFPFLIKWMNPSQSVGAYLLGFIFYFVTLCFFIMLLVVQSFMRIDDVSWGNRPTTVIPKSQAEQKADEKKIQEYNKKNKGKKTKNLNYFHYKMLFMCFWITLNYTIGTLFTYAGKTGSFLTGFTSILGALLLIVPASKIIIATFVLFKFYLLKCFNRNRLKRQREEKTLQMSITKEQGKIQNKQQQFQTSSQLNSPIALASPNRITPIKVEYDENNNYLKNKQEGNNFDEENEFSSNTNLHKIQTVSSLSNLSPCKNLKFQNKITKNQQLFDSDLKSNNNKQNILSNDNLSSEDKI